MEVEEGSILMEEEGSEWRGQQGVTGQEERGLKPENSMVVELPAELHIIIKFAKGRS